LQRIRIKKKTKNNNTINSEEIVYKSWNPELYIKEMSNVVKEATEILLHVMTREKWKGLLCNPSATFKEGPNQPTSVAKAHAVIVGAPVAPSVEDHCEIVKAPKTTIVTVDVLSEVAESLV